MKYCCMHRKRLGSEILYHNDFWVELHTLLYYESLKGCMFDECFEELFL